MPRTIPGTEANLQLAFDPSPAKPELGTVASPPHRILVDGVPGYGFVGCDGAWSVRLVFTLDEPHPNVPQEFITKYFEFDRETPGLVRWGHDGSSSFRIELVVDEDE